jgi:hypothetical protein
VQIRQQIVNLLLTENLRVARHLVAPQTHNVRDAVIIGRHPAHRQIGPLKNAFHARTLPPARRVGRMAPVAVVVVDPAPRDLLRIQSEFRIALAALHVTGGQQQQTYHRDGEAQNKEFRIFDFVFPADKNARLLHSSFETNHYNNKAKP